MGQMSNSKEWESLKESIKKFIKGRWFPLIIGIALAILAGLIMAFFGWRITYAPELENSWDAVAAVAAWVSIVVAFAGVIASFVAVWFAIRVPEKIAYQQNKISLFEKRYKVYEMLECCMTLAESLNKLENTTIQDIRALVIVSLRYSPVVENKDDAASVYIESTMLALETKKILKMASCLFDFDTDKYCNSIIFLLFQLLDNDRADDMVQVISEYQESVEKMKNELLPQIQRTLLLDQSNNVIN